MSKWLAARGHYCEHVLDLGLGQGSDNELWLRCRDSETAIVSKDEDFAVWVMANRPGPAVVWLRTGNGTTRDFIASLTPVIEEIETRLAAGDRLIEVRDR